MRAQTIIAATAAAAGLAQADIIDFEGLAHGEVVTSQYASMGVSISAVNFNKSFNAAVAFDTNRMGTADPDLEYSYRTMGNLDDRSGNVLIIQENNSGLLGGVATNPDDEAMRAAGQIILTFETDLVSFGFDVLDLDDTTLEETSVQFFAGSTLVAEYDFADFADDPIRYAGVAFGDGSANRIDPLGSEAAFNRVVFNVGGSMAFDNFNFTPVPAPSALMALAGVGLIVGRRRRSA
ncbi:MAG: hypothetical protein ACF8Q5_10295 [Phycisphaerales bacterium JB040]